jgi:dinuclear metal center YbgI/SA1388 family protein
VGEVVSALEARYPVDLASDWDAVGLVTGDPQGSVSSVLFAVDPVMDVVDEAMDTHSVAPVTPKGRVVHTLISHGIALYCAHTNADHARPGVSDALAVACGLADTVAIDPWGEPVGTGRVGDLAKAITLEELAQRLAAVVPATEHGIRFAGDPGQLVRTVAVCGGAGDSLLEVIGDRADVYVTGDLRHHRAQDHLLATGKALIDVPHWAAEWLWLPDAASALTEDLGADSVSTSVSMIDTSPWTAHLGRKP